jgi:hypothetical protein
MAEALPKHIISVIERRWQRRLDAQPQLKSGNNDDCSAERCPPCDAPEAPKSGGTGVD